MAEIEIAFVTVQPKKKQASPGYQLTIPKKEVADKLGISGGERMKVLFDQKRRRIIYEQVEHPHA